MWTASEMLRTLLLGACALCIPLLAGCDQPVVSESDDAPVKPAEQAADRLTDKTQIELASWEQVQELVGKNKGKVVVVDVWSTYCVPCIRELPGLVKLQKKYPDQVIAITLNSNYTGDKSEPPESFREAVSEQMSKLRADGLTHLISTDADIDVLYKKLDVAAVPVVFVYGTDGQLARRFDNEKDEYGKEGFTYEKDIIPFVDQLVATAQKP